MMIEKVLTNELHRNILFSIIAVAIMGVSLICFSGYGRTLIWAAMLAATIGVTTLIIYLGLKSNIDEPDTVRYLVADQWLTLLLFCIMALIVDQTLVGMQHRIDYNNCSMWMMILAVIMTASNSISLAIYKRPELLDIDIEPTRANGSFDDGVKTLVNNICAANNEPPRYDIPRKGSAPWKPIALLNRKGGSGGEGNERPRIHRPPRIGRPAEEDPDIRRTEEGARPQAHRSPGGFHRTPGREGL